MVDFRKWLLALAAVGLLLGIGSSAANAQGNNPAFSCTAAPVNNIVRAEGITELVGDMVLNCTGGTPTAAGSPIPLSNVQISINTTITSRIVGAGNVSEALMMIDDPYPPLGVTYPPLAAIPSGHAATQAACLANNSTNCAILVSPGNGFGAAGPYSGGTYTIDETTYTYFNMFQGVQAATNVISWTGVPVDAPGTTFTRIIRITNIRADANQLGVASTLIPTQITMLVSVNGNATLGAVNVTGSVGTVEPGILTPPGATVSTYISTPISGSPSSTPSGAAATYQVCNSVNTYLGGVPGVTDYGVGVTVTEGFAYAWRPQQYAQIYDVQNAAAVMNTDYLPPGLYANADQDEPGFNYDTESGFTSYEGSGLIQPSANERVGLADTGTRIQFAVAGVGSGITLYAPSYTYLTGPYGAGVPVGVAVLVGASGSSGAFTTISSIPIAYMGSQSLTPGYVPTGATEVPITPTGTSAVLTYEIYYSDPSVQESLTVPISVSYTANTATGVPSATTAPATVTVSFSPQNTTVFPASTSTTPIPRFGPSGSPVSIYSISSCACDLLFPFVTSAAGFDTGIAIANTSADPFGTINQSGTITLTYYGSTSGGGAAPPAVTSGTIAAGQELVFDVFSGGSGIAATPNFTGYVIAQANFQYCHGFAFISDLGAQKLAEGYLAIVLNSPGLTRGVPPLSIGENDAH